MNISPPFQYSPPKRSQVLRRGLSLRLSTLQPGEAIEVTKTSSNNPAAVILNTAKRIGIKVTTRKTNSGIIAARMA